MLTEKGLWTRLRTRLIFTGPTLFAFATVMIIPFLYGIYLTFTNWDGIAIDQNFVGWDNYIGVFKDTVFWKSFGMTLEYVFITVVLTNAVAFLLAYVVTRGMKAQGWFRAGFSCQIWWVESCLVSSGSLFLIRYSSLQDKNESHAVLHLLVS